MTQGDPVFAADGAHLGHLGGFDEEWLTVRGHDHTFCVPRTQVAEERDNRVFLAAADRNAARLWRTDVRRARGLRGWWERWVLGPSPHGLGGKLDD
jgi:hypothetical protein